MEPGLMSLLVICLVILNAEIVFAQSNNAFNLELYRNVLDSELCARQLSFIRNNATSIRNRFIDASWRPPRSILKGNTRDLGNYFQCLEINEEVLDMHIDGKYCAVHFPMDQEDFQLPTFPVLPNITWPDGLNITWPITPLPEPLLKLPWENTDLRNSLLTEDIRTKMESYYKARYIIRHLLGENPDEDTIDSRIAGTVLSGMTFELAVCIPKVCTPRQALDFFTNNLTATMTYTELFCRLPDDKTWVPVDTVAVVLLSIIGLITLLSTAYDIRHTVLLGRDPKRANKVYQSFSLYTNTRNFFVFPSGPNVVTCLDGIRSLAMSWVVLGHTFLAQFAFIPENPFDMLNFMVAFSSMWITSGGATVDTFFMLSGLLIVYTTAAKVSRISLLKNLHLFYLNRLLRMFPVLAVSVLVVVSFLHRLADGPYFNAMAGWVDGCRKNWWSTLLYVQNFVHPENVCLPHSWYLAIDMQLYIISPIVLFWVLGPNRRISWLALVAALISTLAGSSVYNFIHDFPSASVSLSRPLDGERYMHKYYIHTLTRASPFFVGMIYGYLLHIYRGKTVKMPMALVLLFWALALLGIGFVCVIQYWNIQTDWDNQLLDNLINSYKRPFWAACVGWIIFACHKGYGGPINWLLSLNIFKILGRLSYGMYIFHFPLMYLNHGTTLTPIYFSVHHSMYQFIVDFFYAVLAAFIVTIVIDLPFSNLIKLALEGKRKISIKNPPTAKEDTDLDLKYTAQPIGDEKKTIM